VTIAKSHDEIIQRCCSSIQRRYSIVDQTNALRRLKREFDFVRERGFISRLQEALNLADSLTESHTVFRLIGSGCTSYVNFLLGLSEVNPVQFRLPWQRFWATSDGEAPTFLFVADLANEEPTRRIRGLTIHRMSVLETIPHRLRAFEIPEFDKATFDRISAGDTAGVFQFENDAVRKLAVRLQSTTVRELATVTALALRECSDPEVAAEFMSKQNRKYVGGHTVDTLNSAPMLFQEELIAVLRRRAGLNPLQAYEFIRESMKNGGLAVDHPLYEKALQGATSREDNVVKAQQVVQRMARDSQSADCLAHHVANAITSFRSAYLKTHYAERFEKLLEEQVTPT
jgi:DNA polymerase III alpha subunit